MSLALREASEFEMEKSRGAGVAQSVKGTTLGFGSGHDPTVHGFQPCIGLHTYV